MREPEDYELRVNEKRNTLEEWDPDAGEWDFFLQLGDMGPVERASCIMDMTATLGTPEVVYRKALPGEDARAKTERLRTEALQNARNALVAALGRRQDLRDMLMNVLYGFGKYEGNGAIDFWNHEVDFDMIIDAFTDHLLENTDG